MTRSLGRAAKLAVVLVLLALTVAGCKAYVSLDKPIFITREEAEKLWEKAEAREEEAEPDEGDTSGDAEVVTETLDVRDPGEISADLLGLKDIDFSQGVEKAFVVTQLSQKEIDADKLAKVKEAIETQIRAVIRRVYIEKSYEQEAAKLGAKAPGVTWYFDADKVKQGPNISEVKAELPDPKAVTRVSMYARATLPLSVTTFGFLTSTRDGGSVVADEPEGKENVPVAQESVLVAYPFKVTVKVDKTPPLEIVPSTALDKLRRMMAAVSTQGNEKFGAAVGVEESSSAVMEKLMTAKPIAWGFKTPPDIAGDPTALGLVADKVLNIFTRRVLDSITKRYREDVNVARSAFLEVLESPAHWSVLRSIVASNIGFAPTFYVYDEKEGGKPGTDKLTDKESFDVKMKYAPKVLVPNRGQEQLEWLADRYLGYLLARGEFDDFYMDPKKYKATTEWVKSLTAAGGQFDLDMTVAVIFDKKSRFLDEEQRRLGIMHPTVQHKDIALSAVRTALDNADANMKDAKIEAETDLRAVQILARQIAKDTQKAPRPILGGVYWRFTFTPTRGNPAVYTGGEATLYVHPSGTGPHWRCPVTYNKNRPNSLDIFLLVDKDHVQRNNNTIAVPLMKLKGGREGIPELELKNVRLTYAPKDVDIDLGQLPMAVVVKVKGVRGSLRGVRSQFTDTDPPRWLVQKPDDEKKDYVRQRGYRIRRGGVDLLDFVLVPRCTGDINRVGSEQEVKLNISFIGRNAKEIVAFLPTAPSRPWVLAGQLSRTYDTLAERAEDALRKACEKKDYLASPVNQARAKFVNKLRERVTRTLPSWLPVKPKDGATVASSVSAEIGRAILPQERMKNWGLKVKQEIRADVRRTLRFVFANGVNLDVQHVPGLGREEKPFKDYPTFLMALTELRDEAREQLAGTVDSALPFIRIEGDGEGGFRRVKSKDMYLEESNSGGEKKLIIGALRKKDSAALPKVFFVRIDNRCYMFYTAKDESADEEQIWPLFLGDAK